MRRAALAVCGEIGSHAISLPFSLPSNAITTKYVILAMLPPLTGEIEAWAQEQIKNILERDDPRACE